MTALQDVLTTFKKQLSADANDPSGDACALADAKHAWQRLIDEKLIEWGRHPEQFEDEDGYLAPTPDNLVRATEFITFCRDHGVAAPLRMVTDGEGGIVFEWYHGLGSTYVEIHPDGTMEYLRFDDCKLVCRSSL